MLRWHPECITDAQLIQTQSVTLIALNSRCWFKGFSFLCSRPAIKQISKCCSVQFSSVPQSCATVCDPINHSTPGLPVHHQLPEFIQTHVHCSVMPSSHIILCHPILLLSPIPPCIRVFSNESALRIRWPKYWSFSFSISPSNEHPGLISFRMDWLDLLQSKGRRVFSNTTAQKHQFFDAQLSSQSNSYIHTWPLEKP